MSRSTFSAGPTNPGAEQLERRLDRRDSWTVGTSTCGSSVAGLPALPPGCCCHPHCRPRRSRPLRSPRPLRATHPRSLRLLALTNHPTPKHLLPRPGAGRRALPAGATPGETPPPRAAKPEEKQRTANWNEPASFMGLLYRRRTRHQTHPAATPTEKMPPPCQTETRRARSVARRARTVARAPALRVATPAPVAARPLPCAPAYPLRVATCPRPVSPRTRSVSPRTRSRSPRHPLRVTACISAQSTPRPPGRRPRGPTRGAAHSCHQREPAHHCPGAGPAAALPAPRSTRAAYLPAPRLPVPAPCRHATPCRRVHLCSIKFDIKPLYKAACPRYHLHGSEIEWGQSLDHGGRRNGAGRKPTQPGSRLPHVARPRHHARLPAHVTLRSRIRGLRNQTVLRVFARATRLSNARKATFQIIHYSLQSTHVHLLIEARDRAALSRGMQGLAVRLARGINRVLGRRGRSGQTATTRAISARLRQCGTHSSMSSPTTASMNERFDPESIRIRVARGFGVGANRSPSTLDSDSRKVLDPCNPPVSTAQTWLLAVGWKEQGGSISLTEVPLAARRHEPNTRT